MTVSVPDRDGLGPDRDTLGSPGDPVCVRLTRAWTRTYSRGLPAGTAQDRRGEIESDLFDELAAARAAGLREATVSRTILTRMLLGVPADLSWRHQHRRAARSAGGRRVAVNRTPRTSRALASILSVPVLLWSIYVGIGWTLVGSDEEWTDGRWVGLVVIGGAVAALVGMVLLALGHSDGAFLVAIAALGSTGWFLWAPVVPAVGLLVALAFVAYGVLARRPGSIATAEPVTG